MSATSTITSSGNAHGGVAQLRRRRGEAAPPPPRVRRLQQNGTAAFRPGRRGLALWCGSGTVVVTQTGDPVDHVLVAGEEFRTARRGRVVAWALSEAIVEVGPVSDDQPALAA